MFKRVDCRNCGTVVYLIHEGVVYFSGMDKDRSTTVNEAESVILAIANEEKIDWFNFEYVDVQTTHGYDESEGWYCISYLEISIQPNSNPRVDEWVCIDAALGHPEPVEPDYFEVPEDVLSQFKELIN